MIYQELDSRKINHFLSRFINKLIVSCEQSSQGNVFSTTHLKGFGVKPLILLGVLRPQVLSQNRT